MTRLKDTIETAEEYRKALSRIESLMGAPAGSAAAAELGRLVTEIDKYECAHEPMPEPDPTAFRQHLVESGFHEEQTAIDRDDEIADYIREVKSYTARVNEAAVAAIVRYCGVALRGADSRYISVTDPAELRRVVEGFAAKKLGLDHSLAEAAIRAAGERMKADQAKSRVTVYYLMAEITGSLDRLAKS
jgi:antitoxin component HigA of HigAB toxin-antitoxin module